jgi:GNAT superfamily N-acetyltransferase
MMVAHRAVAWKPTEENPAMKIRPADVADLPAIERIVRDAYTKYIERIGKPPGPMLDDYRAHVRAHAAWVLEIEKGVAGVIILLPEDSYLLLDNVAVDPARHGHGFGRVLMDFADQEARRRGYEELRLYTHAKMTENIAMYPRLGWQETGRGEQAGYDRVFYRKRVTGTASAN